ncbi:DUF4097 family beta strand repeat protein [Olivibacter sp. SDN3]|uniref:DUF4097 family beta strand repeat-containing protein n=1 Tax=Olivibacter sp. SDN3 TaxID=2764720 RepID=UPI001651A8CD|nr:DUF4097 family beta strand repeat-containing protein [Olivibacter sp. SDN3]QNL50920.1 DUF4097 family beta strand repeat protein [Olivibacter sp. SDN3]
MNKTFLFFIAFCSSCFLAIAQDSGTPHINQSLSDANIRSVDLQTSGGSLTVTGVADGEARLEVYVNSNNGNKHLSKDEIEKKLAADYDLKISSNGGQLIAHAKPKRGFKNWNNTLSISFKAYVPKASTATLKTSGGSLMLEGIEGTVDGATSGGSIKAKNLKNNVSLKTSGGSILAENSTGELTLLTSGGSINLSDLKGKITAKTSGGSIQAVGITGELIAGTSGGSIHADRIDGSIDVGTSAGSATVNMLTVDKYVKVNVSTGQVQLQLPMDKGLDLNLSASRVNLPNLGDFSGSREKNRVQGKLNGGGAKVDVAVSMGNLTLSALN